MESLKKKRCKDEWMQHLMNSGYTSFSVLFPLFYLWSGKYIIFNTFSD